MNTFTKIIKIFVISSLISSILFSCADSTPHIYAKYASLIYEFENEEDNPKIRLSVFVSPSTEIQRAKTLEVQNTESKYLWKIDEPEIIENGASNYFGYSAITCPEGMEFPEGMYEIRYIDLADRTSKDFFSINKLPTMVFSEEKKINAQMVRDRKIGKECSQRRIILFDGLYRELYFGSYSSMLDTDKQIVELFPDAEYKQFYYCTQDNSTGILLPKESIVTEIKE